MKLNVDLKRGLTQIYGENTRISIYTDDQQPQIKDPGIGMLLLKGKVKNIFKVETGLDINGHQWDHLILVALPEDLDPDWVLQGFVNHEIKQNIKLPKRFQKSPLPDSVKKETESFIKKQTTIISHFGFKNIVEGNSNSRSTKSQHRWTVSISEVPFNINDGEVKAEVYWIKRNQMLIKAGATMKKEPYLNKDGSLGFSAKMGQKIRDDHAQSFDNFVTNRDIILKSVNEVGLFLYFAGKNSWLVLKDQQGKTLDAWTRK